MRIIPKEVTQQLMRIHLRLRRHAQGACQNDFAQFSCIQTGQDAPYALFIDRRGRLFFNAAIPCCRQPLAHAVRVCRRLRPLHAFGNIQFHVSTPRIERDGSNRNRVYSPCLLRLVQQPLNPMQQTLNRLVIPQAGIGLFIRIQSIAPY